MSYGFTNSNATEPSQKIPEKPVPPLPQPKLTKEQKKAEAKRKAQEPPTWFEIDEAHNTAIYVSGLPMDITLEELTELFNKCGLIARDEKGKDKIKLYRDSAGELKGDALCTYIKVSEAMLYLVKCFFIIVIILIITYDVKHTMYEAGDSGSTYLQTKQCISNIISIEL